MCFLLGLTHASHGLGCNNSLHVTLIYQVYVYVEVLNYFVADECGYFITFWALKKHFQIEFQLLKLSPINYASHCAH